MVPGTTLPETTQPVRRLHGYQPAPLRATRHRLRREPLSFASAPMLLAAAGFSLGIIDAHWVWHPPLLCLVSAFLAAGLTLLAGQTAVRMLWLPLLCLWFSAGQFCAFVAPTPQTSPAVVQLADGLQRSVSGTVTAIHSPRTETRLSPFGRPAETEQTQQIDLSLDHVEDFNANHDWQTSVVGGLRLNLYARLGESLPYLRCGERLNVELRFHRPEYFLDPGAWNYPAYLAQHGIAVLGSTDVTAVHVTPDKKRPSLSCLATAAQTWAGTRLDQIATISASYRWLPQWMRLTSQDSSVLSAMLFGDRTRLQHSMRSAFERTGSFHLLVVSGLHITIVIGLIFWLARKLRIRQLPATLLAISLALPYAFLTGFAPPVQRALWLSAVYLFSRILYRERADLNAIGIASIGVLVHNPSALFDASFQMTFLAVLAIAGIAMPLIEATLAPYLRGIRLPRQIRLDPFLPPKVAQMRVLLRMYVERLRYIVGPRWGWRLPFGIVRWGLRFTEAMIVALVVELAMVLPMAVYFHRITLVALPANLFGLPLLAFMLPLALLTFLLGCIHPALAVPSGAVTALLLHAISWLIHLFGNLAASSLRTPNPPTWSLFCFAVAWIAALWMVRLSRTWKLAALVAIFVGSLLVLWPVPITRHRGVMEMTAIDVGQGDSLLIVTPDGHTLLVDAGGPVGGPRTNDPQFDIGEEVVSQYLWSRHIRRLDAIALTHAHSDHMGGMPAILRNFHPKILWVGNNPMIPDYRALLALAAQEKIPVRKMVAGERFIFGGIHVRILAPAATYQPKAYATNGDSLVMRIRYRKTAALLEGDAEAPAEEQMVATEPLAAGLLKVGHHGSKTSTIPSFLAAVHPQFAVISDGRHNPFGFPNISVLDELAAAHAHVYRTDTLGLSSFLLNGTTIQPVH
ncbi:MAG TPA: ComEC/Rec2 family competence protein [Acidobacteriaceae bacterium]|nr:ComEC/Rec2 family competence protein [Acidobacteriaceae bacterium]